MHTTVVHCRKDPYDVYIGRGRCPLTGKRSKWGNPFRQGVDGTREEVIEKYERWLLSNKELLQDLHELRGKVLGCWCAPKPCHGYVLAKLADRGFEEALPETDEQGKLFE